MADEIISLIWAIAALRTLNAREAVTLSRAVCTGDARSIARMQANAKTNALAGLLYELTARMETA